MKHFTGLTRAPAEASLSHSGETGGAPARAAAMVVRPARNAATCHGFRYLSGPSRSNSVPSS
jgi:hypothetical protein